MQCFFALAWILSCFLCFYLYWLWIVWNSWKYNLQLTLSWIPESQHHVHHTVWIHWGPLPASAYVQLKCIIMQAVFQSCPLSQSMLQNAPIVPMGYHAINVVPSMNPDWHHDWISLPSLSLVFDLQSPCSLFKCPWAIWDPQLWCIALLHFLLPRMFKTWWLLLCALQSLILMQLIPV